MRELRWNWHLWTGFLLILAGFGSYFLLFARFPVTRDVPWANALLFLIGAGLLIIGMQHALHPSRLYRGRTLGWIFCLVSLLVVGLFVWLVAVFPRRLPSSLGAPQVGDRAPEFSLPDAYNRPTSLASLLNTPDPATGVVPKGVLLVFYRGYW